MNIAILGAGSWGLTLAWLYAQAGYNTTLWDRKPDKILELQAKPDLVKPVCVSLPGTLRLVTDLNEAVHNKDVVILVVTAKGTRVVAEAMRPALVSKTIVVNASKGIEHPSLLRLNQVLEAALPGLPLAVLSGPTLAQEILEGRPAACVVASNEAAVRDYLQQVLSINQCFRVYSNSDVIGVELGGALKNIFAIASGYMATRHMGDNARSALITRGLSEMTRLSVSLGAEEATLFGLSGLGDLLATCNSPLSRNYQVGVGLAQDKPLAQVLAEIGSVAEGVETTRAVKQLSDQLSLDAPITNIIAQALDARLSHDDFIRQLMSRRLKAES